MYIFVLNRWLLDVSFTELSNTENTNQFSFSSCSATGPKFAVQLFICVPAKREQKLCSGAGIFSYLDAVS